MPFRVGVIGLGKIAQDQHLPVIAKNPDFELAAVATSKGPHEDIPTFRTAAEMFASGVELDAVSICTPPSVRYDIARQAIDAGLDVLLEKPPTPTVGELLALAAHAERAQRLMFTTWHSQFNAAVEEARKWLSGKSVRRLHIEWKEDVRHWHPGQEWIWQPGGFGVFDPAINAFSIVTRIMPRPIFVTQSVMEVPSNKATPIAAKIQFRSSTGEEADLSADLDWRQTGEQSWNIFVETSDGMHLLLRKGGTQLLIDGDTIVDAPSEEYEAIYARFANLLKERKSHIDPAPLQLVADCFMLARSIATEAFI